jgi:hypothetical protein
MGKDRDEAIQNAPDVKLIGSIEWSFSFKKRDLKNDAYYLGV